MRALSSRRLPRIAPGTWRYSGLLLVAVVVVVVVVIGHICHHICSSTYTQLTFIHLSVSDTLKHTHNTRLELRSYRQQINKANFFTFVNLFSSERWTGTRTSWGESNVWRIGREMLLKTFQSSW